MQTSSHVQVLCTFRSRLYFCQYMSVRYDNENVTTAKCHDARHFACVVRGRGGVGSGGSSTRIKDAPRSGRGRCHAYVHARSLAVCENNRRGGRSLTCIESRSRCAPLDEQSSRHTRVRLSQECIKFHGTPLRPNPPSASLRHRTHCNFRTVS